MADLHFKTDKSFNNLPITAKFFGFATKTTTEIMTN